MKLFVCVISQQKNLRIDLHDTSNGYFIFIPHWTVFSYYMNNIERVFQCYPEKQIHPAIYTEQKRNTYFQDLDCKNLTSSLRSGLYRNMGYMCN